MFRYGDEVISRDLAYVTGHERNRVSTRNVSTDAARSLTRHARKIDDLFAVPTCLCKGYVRVVTIGCANEITNWHWTGIAFRSVNRRIYNVE